MAALVMYRSGFDHRRFFALDDYYDGERSAYYAALKTVQEKKGDITEWLEYFTGGVLYSISHVKESILKIGISPRTGDGSKIELTRKQMQILERIREKGSLSNKDLREMFDVSRQAIVKEMSKLVKTGIVVLVGKGRNAYYRISE
jgi:Fic family protein